MLLNSGKKCLEATKTQGKLKQKSFVNPALLASTNFVDDKVVFNTFFYTY